MRALLVTDIFPPSIGGPATFIDRLARRLAQRGHEVAVLCSSERPIDPDDRARPFRVVRVSLANRYRYELEVRARLSWLLASHRHVLVNGLERYVAPIASGLGRRFVLKVVGDGLWETARNRGETALDIDAFQEEEARRGFAPGWDARARLLRRARAVVVPSHYLAGLVQRWGAAQARVRVVPNAAPDGVGPARLAGRGGALRIAFVGRLTNWKGVDTLLVALKELDGATAAIAGDGPAGPLLQGLAAQLGLAGRVRFLGRCGPDRVSELLRDSDVLVLPSLYEGLSHTVLEAMAQGVPCVASDRGGNPELIRDGVEGLLVPALDPDALRCALSGLDRDRERLAALSAGARCRAREFSLDRAAVEYEAVLGLLER